MGKTVRVACLVLAMLLGMVTTGLAAYYGNEAYSQNVLGACKLDTNGERVSMRFTAQKTASISHVYVYVDQRNGTPPAYVAGIQGNSSGNPSGTWLGASGAFSPSATGWASAVLGSVASVTAGTVYHLVVQQGTTAPSTTNNIQVRSQVTAHKRIPYANVSDTNAAAMRRDPTTGVWGNLAGPQPIYLIRYSDGSYEGMPYASYGTSSGFGVYKSSGVGEEFIVNNSTYNMWVNKFEIYVSSFGNPTIPLIYELRFATGTLISSGTITGFSRTALWEWKSVTLPKVCLEMNKKYRLYFRTTDTSVTKGYFICTNYTAVTSSTSAYNQRGYGGVTSNCTRTTNSTAASPTWKVDYGFDIVFRFSTTTPPTPPVTDTTAPAAVVNLAASPGTNEGEAVLTWTAPGDDVNTGNLTGRYNIQFLTADTGWARASAQRSYTISGIVPAAAQTYTVTGLTGGTTYYFRLWSADEVPNWSGDSNSANTYATPPAAADTTAPSAVVDLTAVPGVNSGQVNVTWTAPGDDGNTGNLTGSYEIQYSTTDGPWDYNSAQVSISTSGVTPGSVQMSVIGSLTPGDTYYFAVWSVDEVPNYSNISNTLAAYATPPGVGDSTAPGDIADLNVATGSTEASIQLSWTTTGDDGMAGDLSGAQIKIQYLTTDGPWSAASAQITISTSVVAGTPVSYKITSGLTAGVTYYFSVWTVDETGNSSGESNHASAPAHHISGGDLMTVTNFYGLKAVMVASNMGGCMLDTTGERVGLRFTAGYTGNITEVAVYMYSVVGNPPAYQIGIQTNSSGNPSGTWVSGSSPGSIDPTTSGWIKVALGAPAAVTKGTIYHIVVQQASTAGTTSAYMYVASGSPDESGTGTMNTMSLHNTKDANARARRYSGTAWADLARTTPMFLTVYSDGKLYGNPLSNNVDPSIYGTNVAGEEFMMDNVAGDVIISSITAYLTKEVASPAGDLNYELFDITSGTISLKTGTLTAGAAITAVNTYEWKTALITPNITLLNMHKYRLVFNSTGSSASGYKIHAPKTAATTSTGSAFPNATFNKASAKLVTSTTGGASFVSDNAADLSFGFGVAPEPDTVAPSAINNLAAVTGSNSGDVSLTWSAPGDNGASGPLYGAYGIQYIEGSDAGWDRTAVQVQYDIANITPGAVQNRTVTGLTEGSTYYFRVWAMDDAGNWSADSNSASASAQTADTVPPALIANLAAETGTNSGTIVLTWTAPGDDSDTGQATAYQLRYSLEGTINDDNWDTASTLSGVTMPTPQIAGSAETVTLNTLQEGVTYYFAIVTEDEGQNMSPVSNSPSAPAQRSSVSDTTPPGAIANLVAAQGGTAGEISISWTAPGDDGNTGQAQLYDIRYNIGAEITEANWDTATSVSTPPVPQAPGITENLVVGNLTIGSMYYFAVKTRDESVWSAISNSPSSIPQATTDSTAPSAVEDLQAEAGTNIGTVLLSWTSKGDDEETGDIVSGQVAIQWTFEGDSEFTTWNRADIVQGNNGVVFSTNTTAGTEQIYAVSNLTPGLAYRFTVWTRDEVLANWSDPSNEATTVVSANDTEKPKVKYNKEDLSLKIAGRVLIVKNENSESKVGLAGNKVVLSGVDITDNIRVSSAKLFYRIKGQTTYKQVDFVPLKQGTTYWTECSAVIPGSDVTASGIEYYISATDGVNEVIAPNNGITVPQPIEVETKTVWSNVNEGVYKVYDANPSDGNVGINLVTGALRERVVLTIEQKDSQVQSPAGDVVDTQYNSGRPMAVYTFGPETKTFETPVNLVLLYFDADNDGNVELMNGSELEANEEELGVYYWDGAKWILYGGEVDPETNTVTVKAGQMGTYGLFIAGSQEQPAKPEQKFITNTTGATFGGTVDKVEIFDVRGAVVITLDKADLGTPVITWYGKDSSGKYIESGPYIYKAKTEDGTYIYGTLIIAK
ncbi:MAG: hypothetical protein WC955_06440 [Elusimicrobiota bacterium]